jgi:dienelactone hydrolase
MLKEKRKHLATLIVVGIIVGAAAFALGRLTAPVKEEIKIVEKFEEISPKRILNSISSLKVKYRESDGRLTTGHIYWPTGNREKLPAIVFCRGWCGLGSSSYHIPEEWTKRGYIIMIFEPTGKRKPLSEGIKGIAGIWAEDMEDAISYLVEENPVKEMVDRDKIGIAGHSMGGITTSKVATSDRRVKAAVLLSCADLSKVENIKIPTLMITCDFDGGVLTPLINMPFYMLASPSKQIIVIKGGSHGGLTTSDSFSPSWELPIVTNYALAWFDYFLKGDESALEKITTPTEHLSTRWFSGYDLGEGEHKIAGPKINSSNVISMDELKGSGNRKNGRQIR